MSHSWATTIRSQHVWCGRYYNQYQLRHDYSDTQCNQRLCVLSMTSIVQGKSTCPKSSLFLWSLCWNHSSNLDKSWQDIHHHFSNRFVPKIESAFSALVFRKILRPLCDVPWSGVLYLLLQNEGKMLWPIYLPTCIKNSQIQEWEGCSWLQGAETISVAKWQE